MSDINGLHGLVNLQTLILENNLISENPGSYYFQNTGITVLDLTDCALSSIPNIKDIAGTLIHLELDSNIVQRVSATALTDLYSLTTLDLRNNLLHSIADPAFYNTSIATMYLSDNNLKEVPYLLDICPTLTLLDLQNNQISHLSPIQFQHCSHLTHLRLSGNSITVIPDLSEQLLSLSDLDMYSMTFTCCEVGWLKSLSNLQVDPSPCSSPTVLVGQLWAILDVAQVNLPCTGKVITK